MRHPEERARLLSVLRLPMRLPQHQRGDPQPSDASAGYGRVFSFRFSGGYWVTG